MPEITIYSTEICPNCKILKSILKNLGITYNDIDMSTPASLTELAMNNVFTMSAPVLKINNKFYTTNKLLNGDNIDRKKVQDILNF